jgi:repressor LexA
MPIHEYLATIRNLHARLGRMPSYAEVMASTGIRSKNAIHKIVQKLRSEGFIRQDKTGRLLPGERFFAIPFAGLVEAGFPTPAESGQEETMSLEEYLIPNRAAAYMFQVKGDSMIDAGIVEGDLAIVERGRVPRDGDIVIAEVDGNWTMKYFRRKGARTILEPANKNYPAIIPTESLKIPAVVVAIIRKYKK